MEEAGLILFLVAIFGYDFQNVNCRDFAYNGDKGPAHWGEQYNSCDGKYQSPININSLDVLIRPFMPIDTTRFDERPISGNILNNGHTVVVNLEFANHRLPTIKNGPMIKKYGSNSDIVFDNVFEFSQLHFHWGENNTVGSEDRINNVSFPAELHVVFRNTKYPTFVEAVKKNDGLTVLAFFFAIQEQDNPYYTEFTDLLEFVIKPDMRAQFKNPPMLKELITNDTENFYTYTGSLTTPPCSEDVTWIDFSTPIMISTEQIERYRSLCSYNNVPLTHNFRQIQSMNNHPIYMTMPADFVDDDDLELSMSAIPLVDVFSSDAAITSIHFFMNIERFRRLYTHDGIPLTHNFRPIQPLNNRTVYMASLKHEYDDNTNSKLDQLVPFIETLNSDINGLAPSFRINIVMKSLILALIAFFNTILSY